MVLKDLLENPVFLTDAFYCSELLVVCLLSSGLSIQSTLAVPSCPVLAPTLSLTWNDLENSLAELAL